MYGGTDDNAGHVVDKSGDVVIRLTSQLFDLGYHIYTNNYYTPMAVYLYSHRTYLPGTVRSNRCWLPEPVKWKIAKKGDIVRYPRGPHLACAFEDRKHVVVLSGSSFCYILMEKQGMCDSWLYSTVQVVHWWCQLVWHQEERRNKRWNVKVFFLLFGWTLFNTFIVYQSNTAVPVTYHVFLGSCADGLVGDFQMPAQLGIRCFFPWSLSSRLILSNQIAWFIM